MINQPSLLDDNTTPVNPEELENARMLFKGTVEKLAEKLNLLIEKLIKTETENINLKDTIKELNARIQELKMEITRVKTDSVEKEKEISGLKNSNLLLQSGNASLQDKEDVRSKIKELITRIDTHLEHKEKDTAGVDYNEN